MRSSPIAAVLAAEEVAASRAHDVGHALLEGCLGTVFDAVATERRLTEDEQRILRRRGSEAVASGVSLSALVDIYMTACRRLWPHLPELLGHVRGHEVRTAELVRAGETMWHAADEALAMLATGYQEAQRHRVRVEETARRELIDDLLANRTDVGSLVERAEPYGLVLTGSHVVAVAQDEQAITAAGVLTGWVEEAIRVRTAQPTALALTKDGRLVCVVSVAAQGLRADEQRLVRALAEVTGSAASELARGGRWRVGVGRPHAGPRGIYRSYQEALESLDVASKLGLKDRIAHSEQLLVYRVLRRDHAAMADLLSCVLEPLRQARGGPAPLLETLSTYFDAGGNSAETARRLHLSVRAVGYRLQRIHELTGYSVSDPAAQLPLHVAVAGARLLNWPHQALSLEPD